MSRGYENSSRATKIMKKKNSPLRLVSHKSCSEDVFRFVFLITKKYANIFGVRESSGPRRITNVKIAIYQWFLHLYNFFFVF